MAVYSLPIENQGNWTPGVHVGVDGGIEQYLAGGVNDRAVSGNVIDVTQAPYNADNTGSTDATTAIQDAIDAAVSGDVVYLPEGTYKLTGGGVGLDNTRDDITLRGAGSGLTVIDCWGTRGVGLGNGSPHDQNKQVVTGTKTKGTSSLTVADSSAYSAGTLAKLMVGNEEDTTRIQNGEAVTISTAGYKNVRSHIVKVTAVAAGEITIDPPLLYDCTDYVLEIANSTLSTWVLNKVGLEGFTVDGTNGSLITGVVFSYASECWAHDVVSKKINNYPFSGDGVYRCQIQKCQARDRPSGGSNGAGILWNTCTSGLIVDNLLANVAPLMEENFGSMNNVWAYNYGPEVVNTPFLVNHGPHNLLNLYEGNVTQAYKSDGYFGSCSHDTFFRNWFHGSNDEGTADSWTSSLNRFTRNFAHVGNVFGWDGVSTEQNSYGNPNIGNASFDGTAQPTVGDFWRDWKITGTVKTRVSDTEVVVTVSHVGGMTVGFGSGNNGPTLWWNSKASRRINNEVTAISGLDVTFSDTAWAGGDVFPAEGTAVEVYVGQPGWQELDLDVEASLIRVHNYHALASGTGAVEDDLDPADTLPDSLAYESQPDWWTDDGFAGAWPPIDPDSPTFQAQAIPAATRYLGEPPPPSVPAPPLNVTITAL